MVLIISVAVSILWVKFIKKFETPGRLTGKPSVIVWLFICGLGSVIVALHLYDLGDRIYSHIAYLSSLTYYVLYVGLCEEIGKFLVFYLAVSMTDIIKEPKDGLLQAAAVALGFAILENIFYSNYGLHTLLIRSALTTVGHMSYAAIWGYATGLFIFSKHSGRNEYGFIMVVGAVCTAAIFHGLYDYFIDIGLLPVSLIVTAVTIGIAIYIMRYLRGKSPYTSDSAEQDIKIAMLSNPDNFQLNKKAGIQKIKEGRYSDAEKYLKKATELNRRECSTRVFLVFIELLIGSIDEFLAFRKLKKICFNLSANNLSSLKDKTSVVFNNCSEKEMLFELIDDLIETVEENEILKRRVIQFDNFAAAIGANNAQGGFLISDKSSLPMAYRNPGYYREY